MGNVKGPISHLPNWLWPIKNHRHTIGLLQCISKQSHHKAYNTWQRQALTHTNECLSKLFRDANPCFFHCFTRSRLSRYMCLLCVLLRATLSRKTRGCADDGVSPVYHRKKNHWDALNCTCLRNQAKQHKKNSERGHLGFALPANFFAVLSLTFTFL